MNTNSSLTDKDVLRLAFAPEFSGVFRARVFGGRAAGEACRR